MEIQVITNRCFRLFMRRNVSISRNRTKIERLLDWKEFPSKSDGRFSFQCLTVFQNEEYGPPPGFEKVNFEANQKSTNKTCKELKKILHF